MIVTASKLVDRAKAIADMHDNFVTPTQWMDWATQERVLLSYTMARAGWIHNVSETSITADGTGSYNVAASMPLAVLAVYESSAQGYRRLKYNNAADFKKQALPGNLVNGPAAEFSLRLDLENGLVKINFFPEPKSGTYVVMYIPTPNPLALATTTGYDTQVAYPMGWEEFIVLGMARKALVKEESDAGQVDALYRQCTQDVERAIWNMVETEAPKIRNMDSLNYGWERDIYYPPVVQWRWF